MAKQTKTKTKTRRTPKNVTKKIDVNKYTPQALIDRGVSIKAQRKIYSDLRSIAIKRINRLKEKGYTDIPEVKVNIPTLKEIEDHKYPTQYFHFKLLEVINFINNPLSLMTTQHKRTEVKTAMTLAKHGYEKAASNIEKFGRFMETIKSRFNGLFYDSVRIAEWYEENKTGRMTGEELAEAYEKWAQQEDKVIVENIRLLHPHDYKERLAQRYDKSVTEIESWIKQL